MENPPPLLPHILPPPLFVCVSLGMRAPCYCYSDYYCITKDEWLELIFWCRSGRQRSVAVMTMVQACLQYCRWSNSGVR